MPVEIKIISGARKNERIQLDTDSFQVGDDFNCEVFFDPDEHSSVSGRRALIALQESGWRIQSTGSGRLLVNQDTVEGSMPLRSGDIIRLSEMGPDLVFTLISGSRSVPATVAETAGPSEAAGTTTSDVPGDENAGNASAGDKGVASGAETDFHGSTARRRILIGFACFVLFGVVAFFIFRTSSAPEEDPGTPTAGYELQEIPDQTVQEGQLVTIKAGLSERAGSLEHVTFSLEGQVPAGMEIDTRTGKITWTPSAQQAPGEYDVTVGASTGQQEGEVSDTTTFTIDVKEGYDAPTGPAATDDPWKVVAERVAPAVCLLMAEDQRGTSFPVGAACAIDGDVLVTNATLAHELAKKKEDGWQIWANWPVRNEKLSVREIRVHQGFLATADSPSEQIYWDTAILLLDGQTKDVAILAGLQELLALEQGSEMGCLAITHSGEPLTRFDHQAVVLTLGKLANRSELPSPEGSDQSLAPVLLHINASLPSNIYGSPVVNQSGHVVGVYAEKSYRPDAEADGSQEIHYATWCYLARAWLAGVGREYWTECK